MCTCGCGRVEVVYDRGDVIRLRAWVGINPTRLARALDAGATEVWVTDPENLADLAADDLLRIDGDDPGVRETVEVASVVGPIVTLSVGTQHRHEAHASVVQLKNGSAAWAVEDAQGEAVTLAAQTNPSEGYYTADVVATTSAGRWAFELVLTGAVQETARGTFIVRHDQFGA